MTVDKAQYADGDVIKLHDGGEIRYGESLYTKAFRRLRHDRLTVVMTGVLLLMILFSLAAPIFENVLDVSYKKTNVPDAFLPIASGNHILGTDDLGRDQLARLARAGQITMGIAVLGTIVSLGIGITLGIMTGFYGGILDDVIMWVITTLDSIPQLFLLIILSTVFKPSPLTLVGIFGFLGWTGSTRLVRGETISLRQREFVVSARALGASDRRIMFKHIMPNLLSTVVVATSFSIGGLMLAEAGLSFLGLGVMPPTPTWGNMLSGSQTFFTLGEHLVIVPGVCISITVLCLYVVGDGIRDAFDPSIND